MHVRCVLLAVCSSFHCGNAESVVDGDQPNAVVTFNKSTFPRLYDDAADGPGLLRPHDKAVNTTPSVAPRLLDDSPAVQGTGVVDQQTEERGKYSGVAKGVFGLQLFRRQGHFDKMVARIVRQLEAQGVDYSDEALYKQILRSVPRHKQATFLFSIEDGVVEKGHATNLQRMFAESVNLKSDELIKVWEQLELKPRVVLKMLGIDYFVGTPILAIHWLKFNDAIRAKKPADAVSVDEMEKHLFLESVSEETTDQERSRAFFDFMRMLKETHKDELDNVNELAEALRMRYKKILDMPLDRRLLYLASLQTQ